MGILCDTQIAEQVKIIPFEKGAKRQGTVSFGVTSYGYDVRVGPNFKIFTNVNSEVVDPKKFSPLNPLHLWKLKNEMTTYAKWKLARKVTSRDRTPVPGLDYRLAAHVSFAQGMFSRFPDEISGTMVKHQLKLADRQCRMAELSARIQDTVTILVTALWAQAKRAEWAIASADILCQDLRRKLTGERPSDRYFKDADKLADVILSGGFEALAGVPREEILMKY